MGTENLFHKRKTKRAKDLSRRKMLRNSYDKVLIVCEGEKTEPLYFQELGAYYGLNTANVKVTGECGSSPKNILDYALKLYKKEDRLGDAYDRVYCVFDKDTHSTYQATLDRIAIHKYNKKEKRLVAITSVPCFEYWFLLHYDYTTQSFSATGTQSAADSTIAALRKYRPNYKKSVTGLFEALIDKLDIAKKHAKRALLEAEKISTDNPTTHVHALVEYLQNIEK